MGVGLDPSGAARLELVTMPSILDSKWLWEERLVNPSIIVAGFARTKVLAVAAAAGARKRSSRRIFLEATC